MLIRRQGIAATACAAPIAAGTFAANLLAAGLLAAGLLAAGLLAANPATAQEAPSARLKVIASFSILGDLVRNVGGDRLEVATLVGPNGNAHVYAPSPADAKKVADAQLVFVNGLGFEGWLERLVKASGTAAPIIVATKGIKPLERAGTHGHEHDHGRADPHAWQSVANAKIYVGNIRDALIAVDPAGKARYESNAAAYSARLDTLEREVRDTIAKIPADRRRVVTSHDAFGYFESAYGINFTAPQGVSTEAEASAKDVASIISAIKKQKASAVFLENVTDPRLVRQIASETGAKVGGVLYSDALTDEKGDATTYIDLIRHNLRQLANALTS
jgi:zinc/manganese transport system substrate-binding protein